MFLQRPSVSLNALGPKKASDVCATARLMRGQLSGYGGFRDSSASCCCPVCLLSCRLSCLSCYCERPAGGGGRDCGCERRGVASFLCQMISKVCVRAGS